MSGLSFSRVPVNPRLEFGVPLENVCENGVLHPGLRELLLKSYLSARGEDRDGGEQFKGWSKIVYVMEALKAGPEGQGSVEARMSLKSRLESGKWIIATQTPRGSPMWLLRHFLGCLPRPLLHEMHWREIAVTCGAVSCLKFYHRREEILERIVVALEALPKENYLILVALILLIRNLSAVISTHNSDSLMLHEEAVEALSQYFIAAIISRPYRPGLYTMSDKEHKPLLVFLSEHWLEVKELCRHTGISRYHSTCESRYEFVSPDTQADHAMWQAMATAQDIADGEIDVPETFARKSNQQPPRITSLDIVAWVPNVHTPKGVYLIPSKVECIRTSVADEEDGVTEDSIDAVGFDDRIVQPDVQDTDRCGCLPHSRVVEDKSNENPKFEAKKLIDESKPEPMVFTRTHQGFGCDGLPRGIQARRRVKAKISGTQTFECEFLEDGQVMEAENIPERNNEVRVSRQTLGENTLAIVDVGPADFLKFYKIHDRSSSFGLNRSTALLIKNFTSDEEIVYFPARRVDLPNGKVIDEIEQVITAAKEDADTSKADKDVKTLANPFEDVNNWKGRERNSGYNDFVTELKDKFKQGRRKPSDAKSPSSHMVLGDDSEQDVMTATTMGKGSPEVLRISEFRREKANDLSELAEFRSVQELIPNTSCGLISSANSI